MPETEKIFKTVKSTILAVTLFLFPLFFATTTQEYFATNKLYLLAFCALCLLFVSTVEIIVEKKLTIKKDPLDILKIFFLICLIFSVFFSPNKVQALLNQNFGIVGITSLIIFSFYLKRSNIIIMKLLTASTIILSLVTIIIFFQPFQNLPLPSYLNFLKNPLFTPIGSQLDLGIFLGFMVVTELLQIIFMGKLWQNFEHAPWRHLLFFGLSITALILTVYLFPRGGGHQLPPFTYSWYAFVETFKNPLTAIFGIGIDNYASIFTRVKDLLYNQTSLWQINSFNVSRSTLLHIGSETGLLTLVAFFLLMLGVFKKGLKENILLLLPVIYITVIMIVFPPSFISFFLFFVALTVVHEESHKSKKISEIDLSENPAYFSIPFFMSIFIIVTGYLLIRSYGAEYFFKRSVDALATNNGKQLYDNQRQAIVTNPFVERFRTNFSQTNLLIANNLAAKVKNTSNTKELSAQDRQTITAAIQAAIEETKAAVALNPQKASNWENLAVVYRNLINIAQGGDIWTISSYQRAIILDPQNPKYRMSLGGVYYSLGSYDEAVRFFEQAVALKPDWSNAHYNLAWSLFQKKDYQKAVGQMQTVTTLLDPRKDFADLKRAKADLENFKKNIPEAKEPVADLEEAEPREQQLNLASPPVATFEPKLELPKEASPETR